jgi:hypothetical protein
VNVVNKWITEQLFAKYNVSTLALQYPWPCINVLQAILGACMMKTIDGRCNRIGQCPVAFKLVEFVCIIKTKVKTSEMLWLKYCNANVVLNPNFGCFVVNPVRPLRLSRFAPIFYSKCKYIVSIVFFIPIYFNAYLLSGKLISLKLTTLINAVM